ncbi:hypothetical protein MFLAVUS_011489 [Mucor flavus]|uniref:Uncharacterized protein n=1 Tax=Mucor flavus TaxID=439312 RepID=A0ABP9ZFM0_9FUNG
MNIYIKSYKLKTSGLRTQIISDMNEMIINVSRSDYCSDASDGNMMLNMKLYRVLSKTDCIACDGGYNLFVKRFEELCIEKSPGNILNDDNFVYPIRKEVEKFDIIQQPHHKLWYDNCFEFPSQTKLIDIVILSEMELKEKTERLKLIQDTESHSLERFTNKRT